MNRFELHLDQIDFTELLSNYLKKVGLFKSRDIDNESVTINFATALL